MPLTVAMKNRLRMRCIAKASLLDPEFTMETTAALSQRHNTVAPFHWLPHNAQATTIGASSFTVIWTEDQHSATGPGTIDLLN